MLFTTEDRILIKYYRLDIKYGRRKENMAGFPNKPWSASGLNKLILKMTIRVVQSVLMVVVGLNH